nr:hypothetical protein [Tanacetum cinerariifolium]
MSRDVLTIGSTIRIPLLYRSEYSQWVERFINYLEEQTDGEAMINSIKNGNQPLPHVTQVSIAGTSSTEQAPLEDKSMCNKTAKDLWDALARHMLGSEYGKQDRKAAVLYEYETFKATEGELLLDTYIRYLQVINNLKKCGYSKDNYVNDAMGSKNKIVMVTSDPLALIVEKMKVSKSKEKAVVSSDSEGSVADDFSELKKITALLAKDYEYYKTNMFLTKKDKDEQVLLAEDQAWMESSSDSDQEINANMVFMAQIKKVLFDSKTSSSSADEKISKKDDEKKRDMSRVKCYNCKREGHFAKDCKKVKVKDYEYYKTNMFLAKKDKDEQVLLAEDQAWMESSSDSDQEINANMVFMAQIKKVLSDSKTSSSSADEKISKSDVDHNGSEEKDHLVDKLIRKFNKKIVKCQKHIEKANHQSKDFKNQNMDLHDKYDVLKNEATTFEMNNNELNEQLKELIEKNNDLLAQTKVLKYQLQVKHVVIDTHVECQEKYAKLEAERYEYMIRYSAYFDNDKQHRKQIADQEVLYDKISVQLVELDKHVRDLKNTDLEKDFKISELEECVRNKDLEKELVLKIRLWKLKSTRENKIMFAYDYGNLNASYVNEKIHFEDDYFPEIINPNFEKIDSPFQQTSSLKPYVLNVILEKIIIDLEDEVVNLLEKEKANLETIESLKSKGFESSENVSSESENQSKYDCLVVGKKCVKEENLKVIAP